LGLSDRRLAGKVNSGYFVKQEKKIQIDFQFVSDCQPFRAHNNNVTIVGPKFSFPGCLEKNVGRGPILHH